MPYKKEYKLEIKNKKQQEQFEKKFLEMSPEKQEKFIEKLMRKLNSLDAEIKGLDSIVVYEPMPGGLSSGAQALIQSLSFVIGMIGTGVLVGVLRNNVTYGLLAAFFGASLGHFAGKGINSAIEERPIARFIKRLKIAAIDKKIKMKTEIKLKLAKNLEFAKEITSEKNSKVVENCNKNIECEKSL